MFGLVDSNPGVWVGIGHDTLNGTLTGIGPLTGLVSAAGNRICKGMIHM